MSFLHAHKTILVLDHSPSFLKSSNEPMEFDVVTKSRAPGFIPLAPVTKTVWTCAIEAVLEFARIIYDIYPTDKLVITQSTQKYFIIFVLYIFLQFLYSSDTACNK